MKKSPLHIKLHEKQSFAFNSIATEILYGGAAGGGKSHLMRMSSIMWASEIAGLQIYLFRRVRDDLAKNHMEGPNGYRQLLSEWIHGGLVDIVGDEIRFWNGSRIYLCHCKDERDRFKYQGAEIHVLLIDELTHFTETIFRFLRSRVRCIGISIPDKYKGQFPKILCGSNPGNIGHVWVKRAFIDSVIPLEIRKMCDSEGGMLRQFIPARLDDNPSMDKDDPLYRIRLRGLGSEALVKAMEDGDWNIIEGAYFDCWSTEKHVIKPFEIPHHWLKVRSFDWGSASPFSCGWWAVVGEECTVNDVFMQRGSVIRYREWYGATSEGKGLKMVVEDIADGILGRGFEKIAYSVADTSIFDEDGGPSKAERMASRGLVFRRADKRRVPGWDQFRRRLVGNEDGPMAFWFDTCLNSINHIPALQHDTHRPEDIGTDSDDHEADETRYFFMSRPWTVKLEPKIENKEPTIGEVVKFLESRNTETRRRI